MTTHELPVSSSNTLSHETSTNNNKVTSVPLDPKDAWLQQSPKIVTLCKDECGFVRSTSIDTNSDSFRTSGAGTAQQNILVNSASTQSLSSTPLRIPKNILKFHRRPFVFTKPRIKGASTTLTIVDCSDSSNCIDVPTSIIEHPIVETSKMVVNYDPISGNKIINKYMTIKEIGRGCHAKVKLCQDIETGTFYAMKIVEKFSRRRLGQKQNYSSPLNRIRKEIAILKRCHHPNVIRLYEVIDDPEAKKIYLVLEYVGGGELKWRDRYDQPILSLETSRQVFRDVVLGLEYLHYQGIVHRDIKPANLLCTRDGVVKISDFGVSYFSRNRNSLVFQPHLFVENGSYFKDIRSNHSLQSIGEDENGDSTSAFAQSTEDSNELELAKTAGSPAFFAPELCCSEEETLELPLEHRSSKAWILSHKWDNRGSQGSTPKLPITKAIDVWALGITLYCLVFGRCPFMAETEYGLFHLIPKKLLEFPKNVSIPDSLKDLLLRLLEKQPLQRITLEEVKRHPWVIQDLPNPEQWYQETDPRKYEPLKSHQENVKRGISLKDRIKGRMRKFSSTILHVGTSLGFRRRSKTSLE